MSDLTTFTTEANDSCSNIYLIDENLCLGNSYQIINTNFNNLHQQGNYLESYADKWMSLYTTFTVNSAKWLNAFTNIETLSANWESAYSTVKSLSAYWQTPLEILYPKLVDMDYWYNSNALNISNVKLWLDNNFPTTEYALNQTLTVSVNLFKSVSFQFNFNREFTENCYVYSSAAIQCDKCNLPGVKCNHPDKNGKGSIPECNLCNNCNVSGDSRSAYVSCNTITPPQTLLLNYNRSLSDGFIPRNVKISFVNLNGIWTQS